MVRFYKEKELLNQVKGLDSFSEIPNNYWILGIQNSKDNFNRFDDVFYLFDGENIIKRTLGTTNAGSEGLMNFRTYNRKGVAVIKTNEWYRGLWTYGLHKGKMPALKQIKPIKYYRDGNKNREVEEIGELHNGIIGIDFHTATYLKDLSIFRKFIGKWSLGCQVVNSLLDYHFILDLIKEQNVIDYCLIKEF